MEVHPRKRGLFTLFMVFVQTSSPSLFVFLSLRPLQDLGLPSLRDLSKMSTLPYRPYMVSLGPTFFLRSSETLKTPRDLSDPLEDPLRPFETPKDPKTPPLRRVSKGLHGVSEVFLSKRSSSLKRPKRGLPKRGLVFPGSSKVFSRSPEVFPKGLFRSLERL